MSWVASSAWHHGVAVIFMGLDHVVASVWVGLAPVCCACAGWGQDAYGYGLFHTSLWIMDLMAAGCALWGISRGITRWGSRGMLIKVYGLWCLTLGGMAFGWTIGGLGTSWLWMVLGMRLLYAVCSRLGRHVVPVVVAASSRHHTGDVWTWEGAIGTVSMAGTLVGYGLVCESTLFPLSRWVWMTAGVLCVLLGTGVLMMGAGQSTDSRTHSPGAIDSAALHSTVIDRVSVAPVAVGPSCAASRIHHEPPCDSEKPPLSRHKAQGSLMDALFPYGFARLWQMVWITAPTYLFYGMITRFLPHFVPLIHHATSLHQAAQHRWWSSVADIALIGVMTVVWAYWRPSVQRCKQGMVMVCLSGGVLFPLLCHGVACGSVPAGGLLLHGVCLILGLLYTQWYWGFVRNLAKRHPIVTAQGMLLGTLLVGKSAPAVGLWLYQWSGRPWVPGLWITVVCAMAGGIVWRGSALWHDIDPNTLQAVDAS